MLNVDNLNKFGADTVSGIKRCANNESLYLRLIKTIPANPGFNGLYEAIKACNFEDAFSYAHGLKGILANLSLDPILNPMIEVTEHLRNKDNIDYSNYIDEIERKRKELEDLIN